MNKSLKHSRKECKVTELYVVEMIHALTFETISLRSQRTLCKELFISHRTKVQQCM